MGQTKWALLARYGEPTETTPHEEGELLCYRIPCGPHDAIPVLWLVGAAVSGGYSGHVAPDRPQHVLFHVNENGVIESCGYD